MGSFLQRIFLFYLIVCVINRAKADRAIGRPHSLDHGQEVRIFHVPYLVQLRDENGSLFCAGTLVSSEYVVTAAHCFDEMDYTKAVAVFGATSTTEEGVQRKISEITKHPDYESETKYSNAAVLKLEQPVKIGRYIRPIRLCRDTLSEGELVQTPGWGHMGLSEPISDKVRSIRIPVTSQEKCESQFTAFAEKNILCVTGKPGLSHCVGDSGGPVIYHGKLCGIIATGDKCSEPDQSSSFTNVLEIRSFIELATA